MKSSLCQIEGLWGNRRCCIKMGKRKIKIKTVPVIPRKFLDFNFPDKTNCIVIWKKGLAVAVDPGGESEKISRFLKRNKLEVGAYWLTHGHPDHVGGLSKLLDDFPAPVRYLLSAENSGILIYFCHGIF